MPAQKRKVTPAELAIYASAGLLRRRARRRSMPTATGSSQRRANYRFLWVTNFPMFE